MGNSMHTQTACGIVGKNYAFLTFLTYRAAASFISLTTPLCCNTVAS